MSRREQIKMTQDEVLAYLDVEKVANVATISPNGRPHLVPVWYVPAGAGVATWTYGTSQKIANLRRLAQATVLIESGASYEELRGVSMECDVDLVEDIEEVTRIGTELLTRYSPNPEVATAGTQFIRGQAEKRVGVVFRPTKVVSWDHRKLGGAY